MILSGRQFTSIRQLMRAMEKAGQRLGLLKRNPASGTFLLSNEMNQVLSDLQFGYGQIDENYLFFGKLDPIGYTTVAWVFVEHTIKARLPRLKLHEIGHTNNTGLLDDYQSRAEADIITKGLGRSSLKATLDTYYHSNPKVEMDIVKKIKIGPHAFFHAFFHAFLMRK